MDWVRPKILDDKGFTLIDVLIGMGIFAIGILAVASMQMRTVRNTAVGNMTSQATMLANQKMEEVKTTPFAGLVANEVENNIDPDGNPGGIYNRTTTITQPAGVLSAHVRQVQVQVQWQHPHGGNRTVAVNSITYQRWTP